MTWDVAGKTVVVTGGNSGIGKEAVAALAAKGADVVIAARDAAKGRAAAADIAERTGHEPEVRLVDLADLASVRGFARQFLADRDSLHVLVNNAGLTRSKRTLTKDGYEMTFQVNHLGPFLLTNLLLDQIKSSAPARIVTVSSVAHKSARGGLDLDDLHLERRRYGGMKAYQASKLANVLFTRELARRLDGSGVTANALHPGFVATNFARDGDTKLLALGIRIVRRFARTPQKGAETAIWLASSPEVDGVTGEYFVDRRPTPVSRAARDVSVAEELWKISEEMTGLS